MSIKIRSSVFETNSSSCHTVTLTKGADKNKLEPFRISTNSKGQVACTFTDGSRCMAVCLSSQHEKLAYLLTYVANTELRSRVLSANDDPVEEFIDTEGFGIINDFLKQHCNGINIEGIEGLSLEENEYGTGYHVECVEDIDHDSIDGTLKEWLQGKGLTVEQFVLNGNISLMDLGESSLPEDCEEIGGEEHKAIGKYGTAQIPHSGDISIITKISTEVEDA